MLASGSLGVFLRGKNFNRCKRIHGLLGAALERLHFRSFLNQIDDMDESLIILAVELDDIKRKNKENQVNFEHLILSQEASDVMTRYFKYAEDTANGKYGKTAQFWYGYIRLLELYHVHTRSVREGNLDLYLYSLKCMTDLFFAFNHPNYARWLVRYHDNLLRLKDSHPLPSSCARGICEGSFLDKKDT